LIARLEGVLAEKGPEAVVLDVGGVGYEVRIPLSTYLELPTEGKTIRLRIHTHVREDALQLYGFLSEAERAAFLLLIGISKIGPRIALAILSGLPTRELVRALRDADIGALRRIPGVGAKTAERIVMELRDKVAKLESASGPTPGASGIEEETVSALVNLGYVRGQAERAVRSALDGMRERPTLEALVREALRVVAG
jgi:holliday junction DNA helicase RuvA